MAEAAKTLRFDDGLPRPDKHMPGLDCLRGVAILMVVFYHGLGSVPGAFPGLLNSLETPVFLVLRYGFLGVHLFFVLSGFLITGILLDTRTNADYYKQFYLRRALRILPALLLLLLVLKLTGEINGIFLLFSLFFIANMGAKYSGGGASSASPLWTLSVEEQFYLFWPTVIRKLRPSQSFVLAVSLIVLTPVLRYFLQDTVRFYDIFFKTWDVLDFFGGGAALAMLIRSSRARPYLSRICMGLFVVAALIFLVRWLAFSLPAQFNAHAANATFLCPWVFLFCGLLLGGFLLPLVSSAAPGRVLAFFGYISYGLYLCHSLFNNLMDRYWPIAGPSSQALLGQLLMRFLAFFAVSVGVAWLSRSTYEAYFLKRKPTQREVVVDLPIAA